MAYTATCDRCGEVQPLTAEEKGGDGLVLIRRPNNWVVHRGKLLCERCDHEYENDFLRRLPKEASKAT